MLQIQYINPYESFEQLDAACISITTMHPLFCAKSMAPLERFKIANTLLKRLFICYETEINVNGIKLYFM